jgi:hypothetical protein
MIFDGACHSGNAVNPKGDEIMIDYSKVVLDVSWREGAKPSVGVTTGALRRKVVLANKGVRPLGLEDAIWLVKTNSVPGSWGEDGYITFDKDVVALPDGTEVVSCIRRFKGQKSWWLDWEDLSWQVTCGQSAVMPIEIE